MRPTLADFYRGQLGDQAHGEHWAGPPEMVDRIAHFVGTRPDHLVLDVGCGVGGPARRLAAVAGCSVIGTDVLPDVLGVGQERLPLQPPRAAADAVALPFRDRIAAQLWCLGVLAHVDDLSAFAREARRVLRPGGAIVATEAFADGSREPRFRLTAPRPWSPCTVEMLLGRLRGGGFEQAVVAEWPAELPATTGDAGLDDDLRNGRLTPRLVVAYRAG